MTQHATDYNPFILMISPEVVLAAMQKSERLGQLNRHLCRPLDRLTTPASASAPGVGTEVGTDVESEADCEDGDEPDADLSA